MRKIKLFFHFSSLLRTREVKLSTAVAANAVNPKLGFQRPQIFLKNAKRFCQWFERVNSRMTVLAHGL